MQSVYNPLVQKEKKINDSFFLIIFGLLGNLVMFWKERKLQNAP